jgi:hypothetical protein
MRRFVTFLFFFALVLVLLERFSANTIWVFASDFAPDALRALSYQAISAIPEGMFLVGLWWVREALAAFARGELFAPPITRMLDRVGIIIACGAAVRIVVVPVTAHLLGFASGYWIGFDAASMVLAAIGLALKAIVAVLRQASVIQSELDGIF